MIFFYSDSRPERIVLIPRCLRFGANADRIPQYIATRCKNLEKLIIPAGLLTASLLESAPYAPNLQCLILGCQITIDTATQLLSKCTNLRHVEFNSVASSQAVSFLRTGALPRLRILNLKGHTPQKGAPEQHRLRLDGKQPITGR